jgi:hypothetical protein
MSAGARLGSVIMIVVFHVVSVVGRYLDLQYNQLTGFIPSTIGSCVNLQCVSTSNLIAVTVWVPSWTLSMQSCRLVCSMGCIGWLTHTVG